MSWAGRAPSQQDGKPARLPRDTASILNSRITEMLKEMDNASKQAGKSDLEMLRAQLELERVALERERERTKQREYELRLLEMQSSRKSRSASRTLT